MVKNRQEDEIPNVSTVLSTAKVKVYKEALNNANREGFFYTSQTLLINDFYIA